MTNSLSERHSTPTWPHRSTPPSACSPHAHIREHTHTWFDRNPLYENQILGAFSCLNQPVLIHWNPGNICYYYIILNVYFFLPNTKMHTNCLWTSSVIQVRFSLMDWRCFTFLLFDSLWFIQYKNCCCCFLFNPLILKCIVGKPSLVFKCDFLNTEMSLNFVPLSLVFAHLDFFNPESLFPRRHESIVLLIPWLNH